MYKRVTTGPDIELTRAKIIAEGTPVTILGGIWGPSYGYYYATSEYVSTPAQAADCFAELLAVLKTSGRTQLADRVSYEGVKPFEDVIYFADKVKVKTLPSYKSACVAGIIAKNPYTSYTGRIRSGRLWTQSSSSTQVVWNPFSQIENQNIIKQLDLATYPVRHGPFIIPAFKGPGLHWYHEMGNGHARDVIFKTTEDVMSVYPIQSGISSAFQDFCISSLSRMDDAIITDTLAKANDKELDVLTTLAEMPKTISSIVAGLKLITEMTKAAKNKEIAITASYERLKKDNMKLGYSKYLNAKRNKKRRKNLDKTSTFKEWSDRNERRFGVDTAVEITDAITGVWMNYRYNIRPLVYTVQDTVSAIEKFKNKYITVRSKHIMDITPPEVEGFTFHGSSTITHRCWIKRRYDVSDTLSNLNKVIMADIFVTAYELIPIWSIVADWFFNIGPALRAASYAINYAEQAATYSVKVEITGNYISDTNPSEFNYVEFKGYKRSIISPSDHITIKYVNEFDDLKGYDALSFAWAKIRRPVKQLKYRK